MCIKLVNYWDKYIEMQHSQQNVKKKKCQRSVHMNSYVSYLWSDMSHICEVEQEIPSVLKDGETFIFKG